MNYLIKNNGKLFKIKIKFFNLKILFFIIKGSEVGSASLIINADLY
jgi:hypothetical protein